MNQFKDSRTNWKYILIVVILSAIAGVGILAYQYWWVAKQEVNTPEIKLPEKVVTDETAGWKTYNNEGLGFSLKLPSGWDIKDDVSFNVACKGYWEVVNKSVPEAPDLIIIVDPGAFDLGPADIRYYLNLTEEKRIKIIEREEILPTEWYPAGVSTMIITGIDLKVHQYSFIFFFKKGGKDYEPLFQQILSTFKFIETEKTPTKEEACVNSGGTVENSLCCESASDFPNLCLIGACGCSPENSRQIKTCDCGPEKCFNGTECVTS